MEERIIEALSALGINREWLLTGQGNIQRVEIQNNNGIAGIQGGNNEINQQNSNINGIINDNKEVEKLKGEIKKLKGKINKVRVKEYSYIVLLLCILFCTAAFFFLAVWLKNKYDFGISEDSIVLTFVGIAATFIVVSNYAQVNTVEKRFEEKITEFDRKITELKIELLNKVEYTSLQEFYEKNVFNWRKEGWNPQLKENMIEVYDNEVSVKKPFCYIKYEQTKTHTSIKSGEIIEVKRPLPWIVGGIEQREEIGKSTLNRAIKIFLELI